MAPSPTGSFHACPSPRQRPAEVWGVGIPNSSPLKGDNHLHPSSYKANVLHVEGWVWFFPALYPNTDSSPRWCLYIQAMTQNQ